MATGTPAVATSIALEGFGIIPGRHALIADTAPEMADTIIRLLQDKKTQALLAKNGKEFVASRYDWKSISAKLDSVYQAVGRSQR